MREKFLGLIGLAKKAGKTSGGEFICKQSIKGKKAKLVIIAADASQNTKKSIINSCTFYKVEYIECATMQELGSFTGGGERAVISINDENLAKAIKNTEYTSC